MINQKTMQRSNLQTFATTILISIIFILSFRSFALYLVPIFDSDQAVHILMAQDLVLPEDLYYWGQNRLGSLVPILAHVLIKLFAITPIFAVSYVQYFLLLIGFLSFSTLLKRNISRIVFALVWFFPVMPFATIVKPGHPYSPQFALLGCALLLVDRLSNHSSCSERKIHVSVFTCITLLTLSLWLSELSIIMVALVGCLTFSLCLYYGKSSNKINPLVSLILASVLGPVFILTAKISALDSYDKVNANGLTYLFKINSLDKVKSIAQSLLNSMSSAVTFSIKNDLLSLYAVLFWILFILFLIIFSVLLTKERRYKPFKVSQILNGFLFSKSKWAILFAVNTIGCFLLLLNSNWVYINASDSRYFSVVYLSFWLAILFGMEQFKIHPDQKRKSLFLFLERSLISYKELILGLMLIIATTGSLSLNPSVFSFSRPPSQYERMQGFRQLEQAGIIGDYWTSYVICGVDPVRLHCTPHDKSAVRSKRSVQKVFNSPKIYLVKERWLDNFPDQIVQFSKPLRKKGPEIKIFDLTLALYEEFRN